MGFQTVARSYSLGFVMTQAKPTARVLLAAETGDPLLAFSRFGRGATIRSDLTPVSRRARIRIWMRLPSSPGFPWARNGLTLAACLMSGPWKSRLGEGQT